jgi:hypothetical protein
VLQLISENVDQLLRESWVAKIVYNEDSTINHALINTLEGTMMSKHEDYIVEGVKNEHWSIKKDIFEQTYEPYDISKHQIDLDGNVPQFKSGDKVVVPCPVNMDYGQLAIVDHQKYIIKSDGTIQWDSVVVSIDGYKYHFEKSKVTKLRN